MGPIVYFDGRNGVAHFFGSESAVRLLRDRREIQEDALRRPLPAC
jgi:hypothetical protein